MNEKLESSEELFDMYNRFKDYIINDIEALENLSKTDVEKEYEKFEKSGTTTQTTSRNGVSPASSDTFVKSRCTVPMCMLIFSAIDFIGMLAEPLYTNRVDESLIFKTSHFAKHSQIFFHFLAKKNDLDNEIRASVFEDKYRNSMMHTFLPGSSLLIVYGVSYHHDGLLGNSLFINRDSGSGKKRQEILNVQYLIGQFKAGMNSFEVIIKSKKYNEEIIKIYNAYVSKF